jgi:hypothetical protein
LIPQLAFGQCEFRFRDAPILPIFKASIIQSIPQAACGFATESPRILEWEAAQDVSQWDDGQCGAR